MDLKEQLINNILQEGYYLINGKRVLYYNGTEFQESVKDVRGNHGGWIRPLEKQPKIIKTIETYNTFI